MQNIVKRQESIGIGYDENWSTVMVLDYQGGDANNPEARFDPGEKFVSVTELPDSSQGHYLSGRQTVGYWLHFNAISGIPTAWQWTIWPTCCAEN